ncbi:hypothetical protein Q3G72_006890 [Acer saccharum]|nr:hypothetical protein Q3G72_006890 [Acer saccharum]
MDKSDDDCLDIKSLATCLSGRLENLYPLSEDCCIYQAPSKLHNLNVSFSAPQTVSIGPLHHGREELKAMEEHKLRYLKQFLQRTQVSLEDFLIFIESKKNKLRNCYAETIPLASQDFVEMILLDAIFLIEFLFLFSTDKFVTSGDRIFKKPWLLVELKSDIWSLENQIPFFILEDLFKLAKTRDPDECYVGLSISKLVSPFCNDICELLSIDKSLFEINFSKAKHLVDLIRLCIEPSDHQLDIETETIYTPTLPTITELHRAGVEFEVGSNKPLFDIRFDKIKGTLEIPKLRISSVSFYFKNLQMFEALHCETNHVNDYAIVLSLSFLFIFSRTKRKLFYAEIECTRRRSARSSEEIRRQPEIYFRLNLKLDAKELLSLRSLVDSVMKSIESFTVFGSLYETLSLGNALNNARYVFAQHEGGHILVGYSIGVLPKGYMVPSIEAVRQRKFTVARVEFMVLSSLKKIGLIEPKVRCKEKAMVLFVKMIISCALQLQTMKLGIFLLAICLLFFQKAYKAQSIEALRQGKFAAARVEFMGFKFEPQCKDCPCRQVAIPRMLKKDTGQLDDREA